MFKNDARGEADAFGPSYGDLVRGQVVLLDCMRREVLKLEGQLDMKRSELCRTNASLDAMRDTSEVRETPTCSLRTRTA